MDASLAGHFLDQLLRPDTRTDANSSVWPAYNKRLAEYRCQECAGGLLLCTECCVGTHAQNPLHVIFEWMGLFFIKTSLQKLGLRIQFGHPPHERCSRTVAGHEDFVVLHDNGIHIVNAKTTAYDFYAMLERLANNTGIKPPDRYQVFMQMAWEYRHLLMLKRAGWGHNPSGVWGTAAGELAVECPVCPKSQGQFTRGVGEHAT
ncbi:hypothetical protein B0H14DRAFT_3092931 [Mycena olivaceomarginata]|nr:hypothetical protein B0H14DRAFT_3092931 [Mycena olivaceomarginata]